MASGSLDLGDVLLIGENTGKQRIESLSYDPATYTLKILFPLLTDDNYLLRLLSGDRQFEDLVGWNLDGEAPGGPLPPGLSGDGQPGGDFTVAFTMDVETQPFRGPLRPVLPLGSLVYTGQMSALVATPGDRDTYLVELSVGQTLSLIATGSGDLTPTIDVSDAAGNALNSTAAGGAGKVAVVQTLAAASAGAYRVTIGGASGSTGAYQLQVVVNASVELESQGGAANNEASAAQSLDRAFTALGPGADRAAVMGDQFPPTSTLYREDFENGEGNFTIDNDFELGQGQWHRSSGRAHDTGHSAAHSLYFGANEREEGGGLYPPLSGGAVLSPEIDLRNQSGRLELRFNYFLEADGVGDLARVDALVDGEVTPLANNLALGNLSDFTESFRTAVIDISQFGGQRVQFRFAFASDFFAELEGWYLDDVEVRAASEPSPDVYAVSLEQGQAATLALKRNGGPEMTLELLDAAGQVVATSGPRASNVDQVIHDFVAPGTGVYHVRVRGGSTEYALVVTRGAGFDHERNDELADAQDLGPSDSALGHVIGGGKPAGSPSSSGPSAVSVQPAAPGTSRLIVRFDDALASLAALKSLGVPVTRAGGLSLVRASLFDVPTENLPGVLDAWRQAPGVRYAEQDYRLQLLDTVPNDPRFGELYGLNNTGQTGGSFGADIDAPQAWDISTGSSETGQRRKRSCCRHRHRHRLPARRLGRQHVGQPGRDSRRRHRQRRQRLHRRPLRYRHRQRRQRPVRRQRPRHPHRRHNGGRRQ